jgi:hypothetical protein
MVTEHFAAPGRVETGQNVGDAGKNRVFVVCALPLIVEPAMGRIMVDCQQGRIQQTAE